MFAFLGAQVIRLVGIPGKEYRLSPVEAIHHPAHNLGHNVKGLLRSQTPRDKIILHVHDH